jgi:hypothetical protein
MKMIDAQYAQVKGDIDGLYGRLPDDLKRLVRRIVDAPNYDYAAMELLDICKVEWRNEYP